VSAAANGPRGSAAQPDAGRPDPERPAGRRFDPSHPDLTRPGALDAFGEHFAAQEAQVAAFVDEPGRFARLAAAVAGEAARAPDAAARPLRGVPLGVKDVFHVDGLPTRAGSRLPPAALAGPEGTAVRRLRDAGALVVGKTASTELAYFEPAPTRNPHHPEHTPGGSSSGSAAAVATGQCVLALGTQTIGSVGRPAAFCGVVGFKPSYERIPRDGLIALAPSLDHVGLFAPSVAWVARGAAVVCDEWRGGAGSVVGGRRGLSPGAIPHAPGESPRRPGTAQADRGESGEGKGEGPVVLGVPEGPYLEALTELGRRHFEGVKRRLEEAGFAVRGVGVMEDFAAIVRRHRRLVAAEAARVHEGWFERYRELYRPRTAELVEEGRRVTAEEREAAAAGRRTLRRELEAARAAAGIDLWLSPAATGTAPLGLAGTGDPVMNLPWTQSGLPAVVVPAGFVADEHGHRLPLGAQLVGGWWRDEELLALAETVERALAPGGPER